MPAKPGALPQASSWSAPLVLNTYTFTGKAVMPPSRFLGVIGSISNERTLRFSTNFQSTCERSSSQNNHPQITQIHIRTSSFLRPSSFSQSVRSVSLAPQNWRPPCRTPYNRITDHRSLFPPYFLSAGTSGNAGGNKPSSSSSFNGTPVATALWAVQMKNLNTRRLTEPWLQV